MKTHSTTTFGVCYNELCDYISSGNLCKLYVQRHKFLKIGCGFNTCRDLVGQDVEPIAVILNICNSSPSSSMIGEY